MQRFKENEAVVIWEHAAARGLQTNSNMTYSIVSEYNNYIVVCVDFDDIEFFWPPRNQNKGKGKRSDDDEVEYFGGFTPGNVVQMEVKVTSAKNVKLDFIVAERNYSKEKSLKNIVKKSWVQPVYVKFIV